jgi:hypothetical protein
MQFYPGSTSAGDRKIGRTAQQRGIKTYPYGTTDLVLRAVAILKSCCHYESAAFLKYPVVLSIRTILLTEIVGWLNLARDTCHLRHKTISRSNKVCVYSASYI